MPRVSAIIIVLNGERFIAEAIESVRAQDFGDWELIVVDDGSTDSTRDIVQRFVDSNPDRIRLLRHPDHGNYGMSATRNLGIEKARGEFVAFLDADDLWLPGKVGAQVAILDRHPEAAMVYGRTLIWKEWNSTSRERDRFYDLGVAANAEYDPPHLFFQLLENVHQTPTTCNAMMRRSIVKPIGGFDPRFRGMFEDQVFFAKLLLDYPAYVSGEFWAKYRQHESSVSTLTNAGAEVRRAHLRYLRALRRHLAERGYRFSSERLAVETTIAKLHRDHWVGAVQRRLRKLVRR